MLKIRRALILRFASSAMMTGHLPPSYPQFMSDHAGAQAIVVITSNVHGTRFFAASAATSLPILGAPVKKTGLSARSARHQKWSKERRLTVAPAHCQQCLAVLDLAQDDAVCGVVEAVIDDLGEQLGAVGRVLGRLSEGICEPKG